ncbi:hypothetical protein EJ06DRAFT_559885 [Trichodelitschia bisporula]|uniref:Uncharacterized protein n=1 Tax=Trichodelitschia bisporula TaxID=703511 RepID=A0A6G1HK71_9PEZI|nr:hypothetical protein EJ06DRAFT_559885 [Trichodelitschia bisporula]
MKFSVTVAFALATSAARISFPQIGPDPTVCSAATVKKCDDNLNKCLLAWHTPRTELVCPWADCRSQVCLVKNHCGDCHWVCNLNSVIDPQIAEAFPDCEKAMANPPKPPSTV